MNNKSPLRYPGGKTRACKVIEKTLKEHTDLSKYTHLISPFFGGGSFEFYLQNKYNFNLIVNDKFTPLYHFWISAQQNKEKLCTLINNLKPISKEQFQKYRKEIMGNNDTLEQAAWYFVINRSSFSGATLSGGFSQEASLKRFTDSSITRVRNLNLQHICFHNQDFTAFLETYAQQDKALIFMDPPYYLGKKSKLYGKNGDMHESFKHIELRDVLKKRKNWILCYNDCQYIRELYKDYNIISVNWAYGMNKTRESSEILILYFP